MATINTTISRREGAFDVLSFATATFVHSSGPSYIHTQHTYSRLQHTLGVFTVIAHLCPDDVYLRVASLLHDVGHAPFSHMLDGIDGVDHHQWTIDYLNATPIVDILHAHQLKPDHVLAYITGQPANPLRNSAKIAHMDHLDSWVRNAHISGCLPLPAPKILGRLNVKDGFLEMDGELAILVLKLILKEAHLICSVANLGTQTILRHLVQQLIDIGVISIAALPEMTDGMLEHLLLTTPKTALEAQRLWYNPSQLIVQKLDDDFSHNNDNAHVVSIEDLYVSQPLVHGVPVTQVIPEAESILQAIDQLLGKFAVYWSG